MDKETIKWANRQTARTKARIDPTLDAHGFTGAWHNAGLIMFTTCTTCGSVLPVNTMDGEKSDVVGQRLLRHWERHHPVLALRRAVLVRVYAYLRWRDANRLG